MRKAACELTENQGSGKVMQNRSLYVAFNSALKRTITIMGFLISLASFINIYLKSFVPDCMSWNQFFILISSF